MSTTPSPRVRGRYWLALWLGLFLAVAATVIWRQSAALAAARELRALERQRGALEIRKATLVGDVQRARSRSILVPLAIERLGLRLPQDSEITILQEPRNQ